MKKEKVIKWIGASILFLFLSALFSFLIYLGPMLASMLIAIMIKESRLNLSKTLIAKLYFLSFGIIGLILTQVFIMKVSDLTLVLNLIVFTLMFVGVQIPIRRPEAT